MPSALPPNPFVYGRVLTAADAACGRAALEARVQQAVRRREQLLLLGDRGMGKSSLVTRSAGELGLPLLRLDYSSVLDATDVTLRTIVELERFLGEHIASARRVASWARTAVAEAASLRVLLAATEIQPAAAPRNEPLERAYALVRGACSRLSPVLLVDELGDIGRGLPDPEAAPELRLVSDGLREITDCPFLVTGHPRSSEALITGAGSVLAPTAHVAVEPVPADALQHFILAQFNRARGIDGDAAALIRSYAGPTLEDVQRLCHATWSEHLGSARPASRATVHRALVTVLRDLSAYGEKWLADFSAKQQRLVFAVTFLEHLGAATGEFLSFAGIRNPGDVERALATALRGREAILEKHGSRYRFRRRLVRLWFALRVSRVQALIPFLRSAELYRRQLAIIESDLPPELLP